jgi:two-component system chemotaxis sensor kinase CheA
MTAQPAHQNFIAESRDLLRDMEAALLRLEQVPDEVGALDAVFRAAHTIKGSAGIFELDAIVTLTHVMESVLVDLRAGEIAVNADLIALLLSCGDHVGALLDSLASGAEKPDPILLEAGRTLAGQLGAYLESAPVALAEAAPVEVREAPRGTLGGPAVASETWHISLRFGRDAMRNGMDPLATLRYLGTLGKIESIASLFDSMPDAPQMDPESCYMGLEIDFGSAADKKAIEGAFDFLQDDCVIRILPPHSRIGDYIELINSLPEDRTRLGDLLVASGALTEKELAEGLKLQSASVTAGGQAPGAERRRIGEILVDQGMLPNELVDAALAKQKVIKEHKATESSFVRVRADKLDELIMLVGELVIAGEGIGLLAHRFGQAEMTESSSTMNRLVEDIRDRALRLRMVPIGETFNRFNRVVHDLGRELGKSVELTITGAETELDKSMVEKISDPLMHLVRNAIDHGVESAETRRQRGKLEIGRMHLNAYHDTGSIVLEVSDDGSGLNREKIFARAIERGLASPDQTLTDPDVFRLIMEPGFSTADRITNVSGRGVGMDVVKRNVEALRCSVSIDSVPGEGTTVSMRLPLTLAIIDGFLVGIGKASYVVPLDTVVECLELSAEDRSAIRTKSFINLRGEVLPLLRLREVFEIDGETVRRENIVVVRYGERRAGLVVDVLRGEFQTVIKPLGRLFSRLQGISGSTILGNGDVALIVDVQALVERASRLEGTQFALMGGSAALERKDQPAAQR